MENGWQVELSEKLLCFFYSMFWMGRELREQGEQGECSGVEWSMRVMGV